VYAVPGLPSAEELSALPAAGLAVRLAGAHRLIAELTGQVERLTALNERLSARVDELERRARQDSFTSSRRLPRMARIRRRRGARIGRCGSGGRVSSRVIPG
jgi:hypothetical protein